MAKVVPKYFDSYEEYVGYTECMMRAELVAKAFVYVDKANYLLPYKSGQAHETIVVGKPKLSSSDPHLIIASPLGKYTLPCMYSLVGSGRNRMSLSQYAREYYLVGNIDEYKAFYKTYVRDVRIAKISYV